ncbi:hypothetical protein CMI37_16165 [Candidatus Pacearchaeota archaeon]|nr:hypothetical protein [Candidatus Pacearchaeota archaeon]|tara:strand:+ start:2079 stop:2300 length:222 start_codon:yes stop_codon:yes gene_type:complete
MSGRHQLHDATGVVASLDNGDYLIVAGDTVPSDGVTGYSVGCLFMQTDGSAGSALYVNEGSNTSANFDEVGTV